MIKKYLVLSLMLSVAAAAWAAPATSKRVDTSHKTPVVGNAIEVNHTQTAVSRIPDASRLDVIGDLYQAGTTYYDYQHNGTVGRMVGVDANGFVHVVWMNGVDEAFAQRDAYYNCWDPNTEDWQELIPDGGVAANTVRAGYVTNTVLPNGFAFPSFHSTPPGESVLTTHASIDFQGAAGAFTPFWQNPFGANQVIWPKIVRDDDGTLHGVSTSDPDTDQGYHYWKATPIYDSGFGIEIQFTTFGTGDQYQVLGNGEVIAPDVAASPVSNRVAVVFNDSRGGEGGITQINNDLKLVISEDGGMNFAPPIDLTDWIEPDFDCASGDTIACNGDTLRPYTCLDVEFDYNDNIHVAFTTRTLYEFGYPGYDAPPTAFINMSSIWHWGEDTDEFSNIVNHNQFATFSNGDSLLGDNAWQLMVQRPSMAFDTLNGGDDMYCSFIWHDSSQYSANYYMSADIWVAYSCNNGRTWFEPINVTNTVTPVGAAPGECLHERDQSLAPLVTYDGAEGFLHLEYVLDTDVGGVPQTEGATTLNNVYYQRIPLADLEFTTPHPYNTVTLHVDGSQHTGTGAVPFDPNNLCATSVGRGGEGIPTAFQLFQNYPNPFNPSTNIQFDLVNASKVTLKVYNVLGEEVATLVDGEALSAGAHTYAFDASRLASGVYMYRLEANGVSATRKMMLMK